MAEPERKLEDIEPDISPHFGVIDGGGQGDSSRASLKALSSQESNPKEPNSGSVAEQEANGSNVVQGPWQNNVNDETASPKNSSFQIKNIRKKWPLITIILTLLGFGSGISLLGGSALLPISILSNVVAKFNTQETSATIRTNKILASKLVNHYTTGPCTVPNILCRFTRPSNRFLGQLEKNGIQLMDKNGNIIKANKWLPNTRPKKYIYFNSEGKGITVKASELEKTLIKDPEFAARFANATKTRFMSLADSVFGSIKSKFGFNFKDELKTTTNDKSLTSKVDTISAVNDNGVKAAASEGKAAADDAFTQVVKDEDKKLITELKTDGKGNTIGLIAGAICMGLDIPKIIVSANRAFQMIQLIRYSMTFLTAFGAIKAGDATPAEVSAIGDSLTKIVKGKSAMDSFGMKYVMTGDTVPTNNNYQKFSPGSGVIKYLGGFAAFADNTKKKEACSIMTNPVTGAAIDVAGGASVGLMTLINVIGQLGFNYIFGPLIQRALDLVIPHLPIQSILKFFFGDLTQNLSGEAVGDALTSGAAHVMGQSANAGGNMPLTVPQAVAYEKVTNQVQLAYAQEDRATKSPFDASNPNTFLGSIVQRFIPYLADSSSTVGSISNTFSVISKVIMGSFSIALQPLAANAANNQSQYQLCNDPAIKDNNIAAGPFCNIIYGVPTQYLNKDPVAVVNDLIASGDINPETGDVINKSSLSSWLALCTDGTTDQASNCKIKNQTEADYALYTIDHRIQKSMDEGESTSNTSTTPTSPPTSIVTGSAQQLAQQILNNKNIDLSSFGGSPKADIQDAAAGKPGTAGAMTSQAILQLILDIGQTHTVVVTAIQSYGQGHSAGSLHYSGDAVDFSMLDGTKITGRNAPALTVMQIAESILPTGSAFGQKECGITPTLPSGWTTFNDSCDHLHVQVPAGTP